MAVRRCKPHSRGRRSAYEDRLPSTHARAQLSSVGGLGRGKVALAIAHGAAAPSVNYSGEGGAYVDGKEFRARLKAAAGETGVDVVVDMVGGAYLEVRWRPACGAVE